MAVNYARIAATAERLIDENGRTMQLVKSDATPEDADKPWRGPADPGTITSVDVMAVMVDYPLNSLNDQIKLGDKQVLVAAAPQDDNLEEFNRLVDEGRTYSIVRARLLKPGTLRLLYEIQARE